MLRYGLAVLEQLHDLLHHLPARHTCNPAASTRTKSVLSTAITFWTPAGWGWLLWSWPRPCYGCSTTVVMHHSSSSSSCARQRQHVDIYFALPTLRGHTMAPTACVRFRLQTPCRPPCLFTSVCTWQHPSPALIQPTHLRSSSFCSSCSDLSTSCWMWSASVQRLQQQTSHGTA